MIGGVLLIIALLLLLYKLSTITINRRQSRETKSIQELEKQFEKDIVVSFLIGYTATRRLTISERLYISDYINSLEKNKTETERVIG